MDKVTSYIIEDRWKVVTIEGCTSTSTYLGLRLNPVTEGNLKA